MHGFIGNKKAKAPFLNFNIFRPHVVVPSGYTNNGINIS
jgi:hypothetical protein